MSINKEVLKKFDIKEYFLKTVYSRGGKYAKGHPITDRLVLCPLHEDKNPSMGFIMGKDGVEKYHCFGCGSVGDVIQLHQRINKVSDDIKALKEVCEILGQDFSDIEPLLDDFNQEVDAYTRRRQKLSGYSVELTEQGLIDSLPKGAPKSILNDILANYCLNLKKEGK